ncbi:hypothetical protein AAG598_07830 [Citromicrobium bathyomarinum]
MRGDISEELRLRILRQLENQDDRTLSIITLKRFLDALGYRRDRDWIERQLRKLSQIGAISIIQVGGTIYARIEEEGRDHLEERTILPGVMRPREAE